MFICCYERGQLTKDCRENSTRPRNSLHPSLPRREKWMEYVGTPPLLEEADYIPQKNHRTAKPLETCRYGKPLLPHSLRTNQFKSHTVLPIILCLVADALFHPWKLYKNLLNRLPRVSTSPSGAGWPQRTRAINSSCFHINPGSMWFTWGEVPGS